VRPLDPSTRPASVRLVEANGGVHPDDGDLAVPEREPEPERVRAGTGHAALVVDGEDCLGKGHRRTEPAGAVTAGFLHHGALPTSERLGFQRDRAIGRHRWVVRTVVAPEQEERA
jgi:hypothetical protein